MRAAPALASRIWGTGNQDPAGLLTTPAAPGNQGWVEREAGRASATPTGPLLEPSAPQPPAPRPGLRPSSGSPGLALPQMPPVGHTSASKEGTVRAVGTVVSVPAAPEPKPGLAQRALSPSPTVRQAPPGQASALPAQLDPRGCVARELTANVSKAHVRRRSADVSAPQAWPGPPSRSALLPSTALSSTRRTPAPGSSPTRQGLPGCRRPFCDARGRSREHAQKQAGVRGGTVRG